MAEPTGWTPGADVAELLAPLGAAPATRLTDGFAAVEAEIAKLTNPSAQPVDWSGVVTTESATYLQKTAKDLRVATYLAVAWIQGGTPKGLRRGLDLLTGLLETHWEQLHPPLEKMRSRTSALSWYAENTAPHLKAILGKKLPDEDGKTLVASFTQYRALVARRFDQRPPLTTPLVDAFEAAQKAGHLPVPAKEDKPAAVAAGEGDQHPILQPLEGETPEGPDPKLTDEFDLVFAEIQKGDSLEAGDPDWTQVRDLSLTILTTKGKEFRCVVYWAWARLQLEGVEGLRDALALAATFVERFENFHPKRPKARAAALRWIGARMDEALKDKVKTVQEEVATSMHRSLDAMEKSLGGRAASLEGIQRARSALMTLKVVKKPKPKPKAPPKPAAQAASRPAAKAAPPPPAAIPEELQGLVEQMLGVAEEAAAGGETPISLRIRRQAVWLAAPANIQGRKFECVGMNLRDKGEPEKLMRSKSWDELLEYTEQAIMSFPFCFDVTYWAALAAKEVIGPEAELSLVAELISLSVRAPKLLRGTDAKGIGLASDQVRKWVEEHRGSGGPAQAAAPAGAAPAGAAAGTPAGAPAAGAAPAGGAPAPVVATLDTLPPDIEKLFTDGKLNEAVEKSAPGISGLVGRAAFHRNLLLAERLRTGNAPRVAFSYFRALLGQLRNGSLIEWEPTVGARCIRGYLQCAGATSTRIEDERELIDELMILDPGAALGLF